MIVGIEVVVFLSTLVYIFTTVKPNYDPTACQSPLLAWFLVTYLNFFFVQILLAIGHFFDKTTFWIWLFLAAYVPAMFVFNMIGNVWIRGDDWS